MPSDIALPSLVAVPLGLAIGFVIGGQGNRFKRRTTLALALVIPMLAPSIFVAYSTSADDPLGPIIWAIMATFIYAMPIIAWGSALIGGYHFGRERRLDRDIKAAGLIG